MKATLILPELKNFSVTLKVTQVFRLENNFVVLKTEVSKEILEKLSLLGFGWMSTFNDGEFQPKKEVEIIIK